MIIKMKEEFDLLTKIGVLERALQDIIYNAENGERTLPSSFATRARLAIDELHEVALTSQLRQKKR